METDTPPASSTIDKNEQEENNNNNTTPEIQHSQDPAALGPEQDPEREEFEEEEKRLPIKTYHCRFCSHLLIASTRELLSVDTPLKRRNAPPGLDRALILRLPGIHKNKRKHRKQGQEGGYSLERGEWLGDGSGTNQLNQEQAQAETETEAATEQAHYTIPLSTLVPEPKPVIVRREDGFEKRVLLRCGRCRVVVGYEIDSGLKRIVPSASGSDERGDGGYYNNNDDEDDEDEDDQEMGEDEEDTDGGLKLGKRNAKNDTDTDRAIYLLPGSIVGTQDLVDASRGGDVDMVERNSVLKGMEMEWMQWLKA